jgi:hypothetical protein
MCFSSQRWAQFTGAKPSSPLNICPRRLAFCRLGRGGDHGKKQKKQVLTITVPELQCAKRFHFKLQIFEERLWL